MKLSAGWFGELDFSDWVKGLVAAFISGGSSGVVSGVVVSMKDPEHYALGTMNFFEVVGSVFVMSGALSMFSFLRTRPVPELKTIETTVKTIEQSSQPPVTVTTVKETQQVPVSTPPADAPK